MAIKQITIDNIFGGQSPSFSFGEKGQFLTSIAIDPDVPLTDASTDIKTSGVIRPVGYAEFSSTEIDASPIAIINTPKNALTYVVLNNGKLVSYNSSLASPTSIGQVSGNSAFGAAYYNNYIYIFTGTNVSRYGPLDSSPALTDSVWTGSTLGTQTALTNTTYPTTRHSVAYLNHFAKSHIDNKLYFLDFKNGQGLIHFIKTSKTTNEGDTNDGSTYNALDLPFGYYPYSLDSYGNTLVIAASPTTDNSIAQGKAALFFWDTISQSFSRVVQIPDPLCTAVLYQNGILYGLSGSTQGGVRLFKYIGGDAIQTLKYIEEGHPPLQGAIEGFGNRIMWGAFTTYPDNSASVYAYGSKSDLFPRGLHNIARSTVTATASNGLVTALKNVQQGSAFPKFIIGGTDGTNFNLDKQSTTYQTWYWRSQVINVGSTFTVREIKLRLGTAVGANMTIVPKLFFDNEASSQAGTTINSTNYANSEKFVTLTTDDFSQNTSGSNNFYLELKGTGTALLPILLPIVIEIEIDENKLL